MLPGLALADTEPPGDRGPETLIDVRNLLERLATRFGALEMLDEYDGTPENRYFRLTEKGFKAMALFFLPKAPDRWSDRQCRRGHQRSSCRSLTDGTRAAAGAWGLSQSDSRPHRIRDRVDFYGAVHVGEQHAVDLTDVFKVRATYLFALWLGL